MKRILLISGSGLLGSSLLAELEKSDYDYSFLSRSNLSNPYKLDASIDNFDFKVLENFSHVIYSAQSNNYKDSNFGGDLPFINLVFPTLLSKECEAKKIKFVYISTGSVYDINKKSGSFKESDAICENNLSPYVSSKLLAEKAIYDFCPNSLILRPFFIFGMAAKKNSLFPNIFDKLISGDEIKIDGENGLIFNPVSASTCAKQVMHLIRHSSTGIYNLAGNELFNLKNVIEFMANSLGVNFHLKCESKSINFTASIEKLLESGFLFDINSKSELENYLSCYAELSKS